ncbi:hypothetical protein [Alteromonas stellipolaris]|jgi:hypothetical protein|uniref:Lipoprotein n=1 Tax=Alteromonas stellipolaris TaxID=233316 RepID=A0ABN4LVF3_9ALTE|nr:hypothetical protein AVL57_01155 [Alteromonas stellipolaris]
MKKLLWLLPLSLTGCASSVFTWKEVEVVGAIERPYVCYEDIERHKDNRRLKGYVDAKGRKYTSMGKDQHFDRQYIIDHDPKYGRYRQNRKFAPPVEVLKCYPDGYDTLVKYEENGEEFETTLLLKFYRERGTLINVPPSSVK